MPNKTYLIRLTPTSHFFFGAENTFGSGDIRNYLVRSRNYPQQSSLLGLLRFVLLQQAGLLKGASNGDALPDAATALIGAHSFQHENEAGYGIIRQLSPLFLQDKNGEKWLPAAFNKGLRLKQNTEAKAWLNYDAGDAWLLQKEVDGKWKSWSSKEDLEETYSHGSGTIYYPTSDDLPANSQPETGSAECWNNPVLFLAHEQVGIEKNLHGKTEDNAFYKQYSWRLRPGASFAFYATLEIADSEADNILPSKDIVSFGGERSLFKLEIEQQTAQFDALTAFSLPKSALPADHFAKLVLISDAWLPADAYQHCGFAVTRTTPFRFHNTATGETRQYDNLQRDPKSKDRHTPSLSERFTLLRRGSVLYARDGKLEALTKALEAQKAFRDIGYNYFVTVPESAPVL